ncbi:hypothetical protein B1NLA3E_13345 [Bacillus sp. 1NLA3E]|nr:hypothetical protein B1NLA3E_13345 [Bacillus sp. 1NLA3E]
MLAFSDSVKNKEVKARCQNNYQVGGNKMKKPLIIYVISLIVETAITYFVAEKLSIRFIEIMFIGGVTFSVIVFWFSSSGGNFTKYSESEASAMTGIIQKRSELVFRKGPVFLASLTFMLMGLIIFILLIAGVIPEV